MDNFGWFLLVFIAMAMISQTIKASYQQGYEDGYVQGRLDPVDECNDVIGKS